MGRQSGDITLVVKRIVDESHEIASDPMPRKKARRMEPEGLDSDDQKEKSIEEIKVSSAILRSASPVFDQMMQSEMMEKQLRRITVHAHSVKDVDDLIYYICTDVLREDA